MPPSAGTLTTDPLGAASMSDAMGTALGGACTASTSAASPSAADSLPSPAERAWGLEPRNPGAPAAQWRIESLRGWHLPLLDDPAFLPLQPLLQKALLLALPERVLHAIAPRQPLVPKILVALQTDATGRDRPLGLIASRRLNRSGSCWQVEHLQLAQAAAEAPSSPGRRLILTGLLRESIQRARGAASWVASASSVDAERLAALREQGFQPLRTDHLWRWQPPSSTPTPMGSITLPADLQLRPLHHRTAALLWHLEQAACPAHLRQLLDRKIEDILDQSNGRGWILVNPSRNEAVAGIRWLNDHPAGGHQVELSIHPGWGHLLGPATGLLLQRMAEGQPLWLHSEVGDQELCLWLEQIGAEAHGEQVLMARSVWRRQEGQPAQRAARRLEAVLEQLQPRRPPLPTPVGQR
ncbi:MAG: hypothetical protein ACK5JJ_16240 [Cyanobacteriota bacterium]